MEVISCLQFQCKVSSVPQTGRVSCAMSLHSSAKTASFAYFMYVSQQLEINCLIFMYLQYVHWKWNVSKLAHAHAHSTLSPFCNWRLLQTPLPQITKDLRKEVSHLHYLQAKHWGSRQCHQNRRNPCNPNRDAAVVVQLIPSHLRMGYIIYLLSASSGAVSVLQCSNSLDKTCIAYSN